MSGNNDHRTIEELRNAVAALSEKNKLLLRITQPELADLTADEISQIPVVHVQGSDGEIDLESFALAAISAYKDKNNLGAA